MKCNRRGGWCRRRPAADFGNWRYGSISGTKFDDFNDSGVRNNGEPGLPDWRIFQDRNGNGLYDTGAARAVASSDVPRTVPAGVETTSTLFASGFAGPVVDADLTLDLSVPHSGAVSAVLVSPSGASVLLFGAQPAQGGDLRNITFDDQAAAPLSASGPPYVGSYRPDQPLSGFAGLDANGTWTLKVSSTSGSFFDQGTLNGWSLTLTTAPEPSVMTGPSGEYTFPSLPPGTYVLREELKGGWHQTMPGGNGSYTVVLSSGQSVAGRDFGNHSNPLVPPPTPAFSITDAGPVIEGDTGTTVATFTVTLAAPSPAALSVDYATSGGNAAAPADFTPASGTLVFQPGETSKTVVVPVNGDTTDERDENFFVILSNPQGGPVPIIDGSASATILDDDDPPVVSVSDASLAEGNAGTTQMVFTLTLSAASEKSLAVSISSTNGTAQAGVDFGGPGGSIVFVPGETSKTINVGVFGDTTPEPDETFFFNLSDPFEVTIGDGTGVGTIVNDDGAVAGPKVTQVYVAGSAWSSAYKQFLQTRGQGDGTFGYAVPAGTAGAQLAVLPWANLDQVSVRFDKDVLVLGSDLDLRGMAVAGGHYAVSAFAYDDLTHTATWTLSQPLRGDKMLLDLDGDADGVADANTGAPLDGDWASGASGYPSGDGSAGGDLRYRLNVLTGDVNGNGSVSVLDWVQERLRTSRSLINPGTGTFAYGPLYDLNGDGRIDDTDMRLVRRNLLRSLPGTDPAMVWLTGAARSVGASGWSVTKNLFSSVPILG